MKFLRKHWILIAYSLFCILIVVWFYLYQDTHELLYVGFIPYLIIAPGILYFCYKRPDQLGNFLALFSTILLFLLPILVIWMGGISAGNILGGLLPYNDASDYYTDALGLLDNQLFDGISVRRPIFTAVLSFLFLITGRNLQLALLILVILNAISCYFLAQQVKNLWGPKAAVIVTLLIFFFYRRFIGTTLSENIGLALGMAGSAGLLLGAQKNNKISVLFGLFLLSLGMNVRPGALLTLPVLVLWASWIFRDKSRISVSLLIFGFFAVSLGFLVNWGTGKLAVDPEISKSKTGMLSNYSTTLYGIAVGGKGWTHIYIDHPELREVTNKETLIYQYAFTSIRQNPLLFVKGMINSFADFFSPKHGAFSFLYASSSNPCLTEEFAESLSACQINVFSNEIIDDLACVFPKIKSRHIDILSSLAIALVLLVPFSWGIFVSYKRREQPWHSMLLAIILGILLSVPLVPPRDASKMRVYAVTQPLMITTVAVGLVDVAKSLCNKIKKLPVSNLNGAGLQEQNPEPSRGLVVFSILLTIGVIISPIAARLSANSPEQVDSSCPSNLEERQFRFNPGSSVELVQENSFSMSWAGLRIPIENFKNNLEDFCVSSDLEASVIKDLSFTLKPGDVLVQPALLRQGEGSRILVMSSSEMPQIASYINVCGEEKNGVFYSQSLSK